MYTRIRGGDERLQRLRHGPFTKVTFPGVTFPGACQTFRETQMRPLSSEETARVRRIACFLREENALSARVVLGQATVTVWADGRVTADTARRDDVFHSATAHGYQLTITGSDPESETMREVRRPV